MFRLNEVAMSKYAWVVGVDEEECRDELIGKTLQHLAVLERTCLLLLIDGNFTIIDIAEIVEKSEEEIEAQLESAKAHAQQLYHRLLASSKKETQKTEFSLETSLVADDNFWIEVYHRLHPLAKSWVYHADVSSWKDQEDDIAEDIVQAALLKLLQHCEKGTAIDSLEHLSIVIAKHCFLDMRRREKRLQCFVYGSTGPGEQPPLDDLGDSSQEAEEGIYEEWLLVASAQTISAFSSRLRAVILADLANNSCFDVESSVLQQAFQASGIQIQGHQRAPSSDPAERGRQSALCSLAYKRLSQINKALLGSE